MTMLAEAPVAPVAEPKVGEGPVANAIVTSEQLGKRDKHTYMWKVCLDCGTQGRWIMMRHGQAHRPNLRCKSCAQKKKSVDIVALRQMSWQGGTPENPSVGDVRRGWEIGRNNDHKFIWHPCKACGIPRWVGIKHGEPVNAYCHTCSNAINGRTAMLGKNGALAPTWAGGRTRAASGYISVYVTAESPYFPMAHAKMGIRGYIYEHRLRMAEHLGRCLDSNEVVHHKNGIRDDNRLENLELILSAGKHNGHVTCPYCCREFGLR